MFYNKLKISEFRKIYYLKNKERMLNYQKDYKLRTAYKWKKKEPVEIKQCKLNLFRVHDDGEYFILYIE
jgi:hypothetical protein